jgi:predicted dehydrogenase
MRIAVLGCGSIGRRHLGNLRQLGTAELIGVESLEATCKAVHTEFGIVCTTNIDCVWAHAPEIALISTPTELHLELALAAVRRGCHIFVEKPLSFSRSGIDRLADEIRQRRRVSMVACDMRFHPGPASIKGRVACTASAIRPIPRCRIPSASRWRSVAAG